MAEQGDPIGTGELARAVTLIRADIGRVAARLEAVPTKVEMEQRLASLREFQDLKNTLQDAAIKSLQDWNTWALRLGGPTIVAAVAGVIYNASKVSS